MNNQPTPSFAHILASARFAIHVCTDPLHAGLHRSPVQEMCACEYRGRTVSITKDGDRFNVFIGALDFCIGIDKQELVEFVEAKTGGAPKR